VWFVAIAKKVSTPQFLPEELFSIILLKTGGNVSDLSGKLLELKKKGVDIGFIALRRAPDGVYSEDVDNYISFLLTFDYAKERSPIALTDKGKFLCTSIIKNAYERNPDALKALAKALGVKVQELI
jgi:hypothetical protein